MSASTGLGTGLENVEVDGSAAGVATITLARPRVHNALDARTLTELADAIERCDREPGIRAVVLRGSGERAFSAGGDISAMATMTPAQFYDYNGHFARAIRAISEADVPVVAAVQGYAFGGGWSLCQAADLVLASERASFGMQEIEVGLFGGAEFFAAVVGKFRAAEILLLGHRMGAEEAHRMGLVNRVVPHEELDTVAMEWATQIAHKSPTAVRYAKKVLRMSLTLSPMEIGAVQAPLMALCFDTVEQRSAMARVLEASRARRKETL
jgi:enoyl-CoA hydratase